ncbi:hypothetical protein LguiB_021787 [Lonicera macranthoides]
MEVILLPQQWCVLLLFLLLAAAASPPPISMPGCPDKCGDESVPYPFGFGRSECFKSSSFELNCTYDVIDKKHKLSQGGFKIENIFMENGTATINVPMLYSCYKNILPGEGSYYSRLGNTSYYSRYASWLGTNVSAFTVSSKQNKFTALGCSTVAKITDSRTRSFMTGCFSACYNKVNLTEEDGGGGCTGRGCCRTQIPKGFKFLHMSLETEFELSRRFSPCTYAFLANQDWIGFTSINLTDTSDVSNHTSPVVVDWVVGKETCESFSINPSTYACGHNTNCNDSYNGPGYFCSCKQGYQGNPYLGCQDIDECKDKKHNCEGTCENTAGSFTCHCPFGTHVDDKGACKGFRLTNLAVVIGVCLSLVVVVFFLWMECKRSNKARNFSKNGGTL